MGFMVVEYFFNHYQDLQDVKETDRNAVGLPHR